MGDGFGLPLGPTFKPTVEEWKDPLAYLNFVRSQAELVGVAKIIPPKGWKAPSCIDKQQMRFSARTQFVNQLHSKDASVAVKQFWDGYIAFQEANGVKTKRKPTFAGQEIDLYRLFRLVTKRGGFSKVSDDKGWRDIVAALQVRRPKMCSAGICGIDEGRVCRNIGTESYFLFFLFFFVTDN